MVEREEGRQTLCISTQIGCGMGCAFCVTGRIALRWHLTTGEVADPVNAACSVPVRASGPQDVATAAPEARPDGVTTRKISGVAYMGWANRGGTMTRYSGLSAFLMVRPVKASISSMSPSVRAGSRRPS